MWWHRECDALQAKAHVGHPVGFVNDDTLDVIEFDGARLHEVFETPRARNENVGAVLEGIDLFSIRNAAIHRGNRCSVRQRFHFRWI